MTNLTDAIISKYGLENSALRATKDGLYLGDYKLPVEEGSLTIGDLGNTPLRRVTLTLIVNDIQYEDDPHPEAAIPRIPKQPYEPWQNDLPQQEG